MNQNQCELCKLARGENRTTNIYYEDETMVICDCRTCKIPMVVYKKHSEPTQLEVNAMIAKSNELFGDCHLRFLRRSIPDHYHFHVEC